jgi:hypothetical protein
LGNHPGIVGAGELAFLVQGWKKGDYCSCGRPLEQCDFWGEVKKVWMDESGLNDLDEYLSLQEMFEKYRSLPRLLRERFVPSLQFRTYRKYTKQLFVTVQELSGAKVIADSSKNPMRVFSLAAIPEFDLHLLFLIRDVRGVVWSRKKAFQINRQSGFGWTVTPTPVRRSAWEWVFVNLLSEIIGRSVGNFLPVRYEDLVSTPKETVSKIGELIETDLSQLSEVLASGQSLKVSHVCAGNRLRMKKGVSLRKRLTWQSEMSADEQSASWQIAGWLMKRYGYKN